MHEFFKYVNYCYVVSSLNLEIDLDLDLDLNLDLNLGFWK
jgi:hypothetical protein